MTHVHLLACINTHLVGRPATDFEVIRILDAGCGTGALLEYLAGGLAALHPTWQIDLYGFDVADHGVQADGFLNSAVSRLRLSCPGVDWSERIRLIESSEPWPFPSEWFDIVISNQVLEHVVNVHFFVDEVQRVLVRGGVSINLFPLRHYLHEGHLKLPFVHRILSFDARREYIMMLSWAGLGRFRAETLSSNESIGEYAERHSDYVQFWTSYRSEKEFLTIAARARLRASFRYTPEFYWQKLLILVGSNQTTLYRNHARGILDSLGVKLFRYISSSTLVLEKDNIY